MAVLLSLAAPATATATGAGVRVAVANASMGGARADDDGILVRSTVVFRVDPAAGAVHVGIDLTLTNQLGRLYFFPRFGYPILAEAVNVAATRPDGRALSVRIDALDEFVSVADMDLSPDLDSGETQTIHLSFDLPALPPRSTGFTRVNPAFVTFPAFAVGDAGEVTVEVRIPEALESEIVGDPMTRRTDASEAVYTARAIADPSVWSVVVVARDDAALVERRLELEGHEAVVRAWPDDAAWADFMDAQLRRGLPVLEDLIGQDWPTDAPLEVIETAAPYAYGYAGWYSSGGNTVEIGDEFLPDVIFHELAHIWFNDRMFVERWVNEAFAEEYSWRALEQLGEPPAPPEPVAADDPAAFDLNAWSDPSIVDDQSDAREHYGYNTSWSVLHEVSTEVGLDQLADVLDAVADRDIAYQGDGPPEEVGSVTSWRRLLDLLQEVGGSQQAEPLFLAHVVTDDQAAVLGERARLRTDYATLVKDGHGWTAPEELRQAMASWRFDDAEALIGEAEDLLATKADLLDATTALGLDLPAGLEDAYETGDELDDIAVLADAHLAAAARISTAGQALDGDRGVLATVGLWGSDGEQDLRAAAEAFEAGDHVEASSLATAVVAEVERADTVGLRRLLGVSVALVVLGTLALLARRYVRRRGLRPGPDEVVDHVSR